MPDIELRRPVRAEQLVFRSYLAGMHWFRAAGHPAAPASALDLYQEPDCALIHRPSIFSDPPLADVSRRYDRAHRLSAVQWPARAGRPLLRPVRSGAFVVRELWRVPASDR